MRNPFRRSDPASYEGSRKETAKWLAGRPARVKGHWRGGDTKAARQGQAWEQEDRRRFG